MNKQCKYPIVFFTLTLVCVVLHWCLSDEVKTTLLTTPLHLTHFPTIQEFGKAILSGFLHANFDHLLSNSVLLVLMGYPLEREIGHKKALLLLLCAGLGALVIHVFSNPWSPIPFLGASGYVFGILAVFILSI